ncbi:MAG TPA: hypothetical protein VLQ88_09600 [Chromatiaceae bacterium]|nr:hypothetical protein [Chromatiaceae bacterium]
MTAGATPAPGPGADTPGEPGGANPAPSLQAGEVMVGREIDGGDPFDRQRFVPLTPEEMEAELDAIEAAESELDEDMDPIEALLERVSELRDLENEAGARQLLYRVLADGDETQRGVAMNILTEMDRP